MLDGITNDWKTRRTEHRRIVSEWVSPEAPGDRVALVEKFFKRFHRGSRKLEVPGFLSESVPGDHFLPLSVSGQNLLKLGY